MSEAEVLGEELAEGMARQRDAIAAALYDGARRLGWKVGMNAPAAQQAFGLDAPVAAMLTDATLLADGATVSLDGWETPIVEAEIAARLGRDVPGDATREEAMAAVDALAPAIELVDLGAARPGVGDILAGSIFHRGVLLGAWDEGRAGLDLDGVRVTVRGCENDVADADPQAVADLGETLRHTAWFVAAAGDGLRAGDVVILGAMVPVARAEPGQRVTLDLGPLGTVGVGFTGGAS